MIQDINKLVEMALEFSDIADDPTDPETHAAMVGELATIYVPVVSDKFWDAVRNGVPLKMVTHPRTNKEDVYFDQREAVRQAHYIAWKANGETNDPRKGVVIVAEKKIASPAVPGEDFVSQIAAQAGVVKRTFFEPFVHPKEMFGVLLEDVNEDWAMPIRQFIARAKRGDFEPAILPSEHKGGRYGKPTQEGWQHAVLRYVQSLLNYSTNYFDYLTGDDQNRLGRTVVREATKLGLNAMLNWTGVDFMHWIYRILPPMRDLADKSEEDDIASVINGSEYDGSKLPFYRLLKKYTDNYAYEIHSGRKQPPEARD